MLERALAAIREAAPQRVVVFTGAGVSAESGIPTFRGAGGLWREFRAEDLATPEAFARDPRLVWEWYEWRRGLIREAKPNAAHEAIARLSEAVVVTQNVDGLHARAGSSDVIELHGNIFRVRCVHEGDVREAYAPLESIHCTCGALLRPDVVWFGEMLPEEAFARAAEAIREADLLLVIGTSGVVYPAAGLVSLHRGISVEINPQASGVSSACKFAIPQTAAAATPPIVEVLLEVKR
ncbi:MAG TPA: NAD-dependent deacylase [Thermoanaerobaculia bacterium]|jgi:NAD-dependent deacetylase|nr:NAD-dependent deacylase [Thermoanaerobaculia bacterium]